MRKNNFPRRNTGILILTVGLIAVPTGAQQSLMRILSPSAGTVVRPGQTIAISVSADASVEKLVLIGQRPLGVGQISSGAAPGIMARGLGEAGRVQFGLRIPAQTQPGIYRVTAMGRVSGGDVESEAVTIDVEKSEEPVRTWMEPSVIQFEHVDDHIPVRLLGAFADGSSEELTKSSKTTFASGDPRVATVTADGVVTSVGPGKTSIRACTPSTEYSIAVRVP
ncbi:MAG: Ig-like domain-containing protein [Candidatus Sulfotelmatobacter sp.]